MARLLDDGLVAERLATHLDVGAAVESIEARQIDYVPGRFCRLLWRVWIDGVPRVVVGSTSADGSLERQADHYVAAPSTGRDDPIRSVCGWDSELGAAVSWFPHDPMLPALARPDAGLPARLGDGATIDLGYRPGDRAVRRIGDVVVKWYGSDPAHRRAISGFAWAEHALGAATPNLIGADAAARVTVQPWMSGAPVAREQAADTAADAGVLLRRLHASATPLRSGARSARMVLGDAHAAAALLRAIRPDMAERIDALTARLTRTAPHGASGAPSHGDFNVSQLLCRTDGSLIALDFDELCIAAPAYDVAGYVANVAGGRPGDGPRAAAVLDALLAGYGTRPDAFNWYLTVALLRRARSPFRLQKAKWPQRVAAGIALAEEALGW